MKRASWLVVGLLAGFAIAVLAKEARKRCHESDEDNLRDSIDQNLEELGRRVEESV